MIKVSVITPFYNGSQYIQKCIENIQTQSFKDFEHIIIDDGSAKSENKFVSDIAAKYSNIIFISQKNGGAASAVNAGIKIAKGEYIAFCDQDDVWLPEKLKEQVEYLEGHADVGMVYSDAFVIDGEGRRMGKTWMESRAVNYTEGGYGECAEKLFVKNFICAPLVVLMRKNIFNQVGFLEEKFSSAYDYDYWFRILEAGFSVGFINEPLASWRTHGGQESARVRKQKKITFRIWWAFLSRRPDFFFAHPFVVFKKIIKSGIGMLLNRTVKISYQEN